jgi:uncharacterized protein (DUF2141 family)
VAVQSRITTRVYLLFALMVTVFTGQSVCADELPGILTIEISGLKEATGSVHIAVYSSDSTWLEEGAVLTRTVVIADALDGDLVRTDLELPMGEYAVSAYHDVDGNGELATNFIGLPSEPIAVSNNKFVKYMKPKYEDAVFTLGAEPVIQHIIMREL